MAATGLESIIIFDPQYKSVIWGGNLISTLKGENIPQTNIGESWEISAVPGNESIVADGDLKGKSLNELCEIYGEELLGSKVVETYGKTYPLLIKIIDANDNLSVQVHPDDALAARRHNSLGKTEMWYIIDARPDAKIYCGQTGGLTKENYDRHISDNTIMDKVKAYKSEPGQFYFIPAGTIHAIGAGNLIAEIQESSDITYRVYDYNRLNPDGKPRELHTEQARDAIDYTYPNEVHPTAEVFRASKLKAVSCDHFTVDYLTIEKDPVSIVTNGQSFVTILVAEGSITIHADAASRTLTAGHTALIPASVKNLSLSGSGKALSVYI